MGKLGFWESWIKRTAILYRNANSCISLAGERAPFLSQSIRHGCPLAPSLFLLYNATLSSFLNSRHLNLRSLPVPWFQRSLLDIQFPNDTTVYLENMKKLESGSAMFCKRSDAMINWHKSCAIWVSHEAHPTWHPNHTFKWINQGASTKYLGFQIVFNIPSETMIETFIHSIQQKLIHWSLKKLSLAGRIIVENQILRIAWYNLSCWTTSKEIIHQI